MAQDSYKVVGSQAAQLLRQVQRAVFENKKIYTQIVELDAKFTHKLYEPIKNQGINQMFLKPLILRQIDQLLEEKQVLLTKKQMLNFRANEQKSKKQQVVNENASSYWFLRNTWTRLPSKSTDSCERIDNLNKIVGIIKNSIKQATQSQQNCINAEVSSVKKIASFLDGVAIQKFRQQIQRHRMRNEQLQMKCQMLAKLLQHKNRKISQMYQKISEAENKIQQSNSALELAIKQQQNLRKIKQNLENQVQKLQMSTNQAKERKEVQLLIFSSQFQDFKIKIETDSVFQLTFQETRKSLAEILQFLRPKLVRSTFRSIQNSRDFPSNLELQIPFLSLHHTQSTKQSIMSQRNFTKTAKFIPMRSQRSCKMRDQMQSINNSESAGEDHEETRIQQNQNSSRKFFRKGDLPLTSGRFRRIKMQEDISNLARFEQ